MTERLDSHRRYMRRLAACSTRELCALRDYVAARKGSLRCGSMMLSCITAALLARVGLSQS